VDRLNERIAHLYDPTIPHVLRLIKWTADAAIRRGFGAAFAEKWRAIRA